MSLSVNSHAPILQDQFGRVKRKLRISVTDRCNFKCLYCMPEHPEWMAKKDLLSFEALFVFCRLMVQQGIAHIRITGGEPLMRQGIVHFIAELQTLRAEGLTRISMTTNAHYLAQYAADLKIAGLDDLNISLDSIDATQFLNLTQKSLAPVLAGIKAAQQQKFNIKINCVLIRGHNEQQILPLLHWAIAEQLCLRFIEFMPLDGDRQWHREQVISEQEILDTVARHFQLKQLPQGSDPARMYHIQHGYLTAQFGIISTISHSFCSDCDRIRLTAKGELFNCLFAVNGLALKNELEDLVAQSDIAVVKQGTQHILHSIRPYIWRKAAGYAALQAKKTASRKISMHMIGG